MKMRSFAFLGAVAMVAVSGLMACTSDLLGGSGGVGGVGGSGSGGSGGGTACAASCGVAITDYVAVCSDATASLAFYDALQACASGDMNCAADCGAFIQGGSIDGACATCLQQGACATEFTDCSNDV